MVGFFDEAITPACHKALEFLGHQSLIHDFYLAGGTALALQLGHRVSTDLDWFSSSRRLWTPEREQICQALGSSGQFELVSEQDGLLFTRLWGADVPPEPDFRSLRDFGSLSLAAINARGTRRDFVDVYCLRDIVSLYRLLELAVIKYADRPGFLSIAVRALAYFEDAEQQPMPKLLVPVRWDDVRAYCEAAARQMTRRLSGLD